MNDAARTDPLRAYADLYHQALECHQRLDAIRSMIAAAAEALEKRPEHFRFEGVRGARLPAAATPPFGPADAWPTAAQIQQVVADWHATAGRLVTAWDALWPRDREMLARSSPETAHIPRMADYSKR